jgi:hypothetical protein
MGRRNIGVVLAFCLAFEWDVFSEIGYCNIRILEAAGMVETARSKTVN